MGDCVGPRLLAGIWSAELSFFLRSGQSVYCGRVLARKLADIFLAGIFTSVVPESILRRPGGRVFQWTAPDRRNGIYVRSAPCPVDSPAQPVSCGDTAAAVVGDLAFGLRRKRLEGSDAHRLDCGSDQLLLATAIRCELGSRTVLSRAAHSAWTKLSVGISDNCSCSGLLSDAPLSCVAHATMAGKILIFLARILFCRIVSLRDLFYGALDLIFVGS